MNLSVFTENERRQIREHGLTEQQITEQLALFEKGTPYVTLVRPCTTGDGIIRFDRNMHDASFCGLKKRSGIGG
jgi:hypothetical protein